MSQPLRLISLEIDGYRPFSEFYAPLGRLEVMVGANGSGKSSVFEFLKFLRDGMYKEIPPEIISGSIGQQIFHRPGADKLQWNLEIETNYPISICYKGSLIGPKGKTQIAFERVETSQPLSDKYDQPYLFMDIQGSRGVINQKGEGLIRTQIKPDDVEPMPIASKRNQLALGSIINPNMVFLYELSEYIRNWRFYSSFKIANDEIRKSVLVEQEPVLHEDGGNLSAVLHYFLTEYPDIFNELQQHLRSLVPGFKRLTVKSRGGPGEVIAFWQEDKIDEDFSLADLSDGILRLICWLCLCLHPHPSSLICIDEPDQGVHPRTLPLLAGLFQKASLRSQIILATHSSYFLSQFDLSEIAVLRKENGAAKFVKPGDSTILKDMLEDFGTEEIEKLHRTDELEFFA